MKIIDKNKDYYDFLMGVYGQDPKAVYLRTPSLVFDAENRPPFMVKTLPENVVAYQGEIVVRCGNVCHYIYYENTGNGTHMEEFFSQKVSVEANSSPLSLSYSMTQWEKGIPKLYAVHFSHMPSREKFKQESIKSHTQGPSHYNRRRYGEPGPLIPYGYFTSVKSFDNPILSTFPLTIIPAENVFIEVQDWLLSHNDYKTVKDSRTDIEKLEAAGFDKKTSFRNVK